MAEKKQYNVMALSRSDIEKAVAETPPSGKHRGILAVAAVATLGSLLFGYDTGVISGALPYMYMPIDGGGLHISAFQEGLVGGILTFGAAFGALVGGRLSDRYGRRHNLIMLAILFIIGALGNTFAPNVLILYPFRFILGWAVGGASATVPVFLAETAPKRIRGTIVAIDQLMIVTGQLLAFTMNSIIARAQGGPHVIVKSDPNGQIAAGSHTWDEITTAAAKFCGTGKTECIHQFTDALVLSGGNGSTWRFMIVLCTLPAIGLWIGMHMMPESSRWYISHNRFYEAIGSLKRVRSEKDGPLEDELIEMVQSKQDQMNQKRTTFKEMIQTPWLRKLMLVGIFLAMVNQTSGVNTVMYYAPKVLTFAGMGTEAAIAAQVANGVMSVIGSALGLWLIVKFSRRAILIADAIGVGISLLAIAALFHFQIAPAIEHGGAPPAWAPFTVLALMGIFMLIVQSSNGTVVWTMLGEIFPASARGVMNGLAVFCMWITNAGITFIFPKMMETLGGGGSYLIFGGLNLVIAVILWKIMPETSNKSMEEIEVYVRSLYDKDYAETTR